MKKYHLYGIGNALVDKEFEVEDSFFDKHGIQKGFMTLVTREQQQALIDELEADAGLRKQAGGGSAANTLYAFSQFGGKAYFSGKIANDDSGDFYVSQLGDYNIETNLGNEVYHGSTGRCLVMISPDAERTMHTYLGVSAEFSVADLVPDIIRESEYVYIEGYLVSGDDSRAAAKEMKRIARANGVKTAMTFSDPAMVEYFRSGVADVLDGGVDLLFCNEKEALLWTGAADLDSAFSALKQHAARFVITRGSQGAVMFDGQSTVATSAVKAHAIDTNGAGDMFAGAFLYGITHGHDFATAGRLAATACAKLVTSFGPRLEPHEHREILQQLSLG